MAGRKWTVVKTHRAAIKKWHSEAGFDEPPFDSRKLQPFWRGLFKSCDTTPGGKAAIGRSMARRIIQDWFKQKSLDGYRNAFVATIQYWLSKRFDEVASLQRRHIIGPTRQGFNITIDTQKNWQNVPQTFPLPHLADDGFKVGAVVQKFLDVTRGLSHSKTLVRATAPGGAYWGLKQLSNAAFNKALRTALFKAGVPKNKLHTYSSHSLRKGGFTAMRRAGAPADCAQRIIAHKSAASAKPYLQATMADLRRAVGKA